MRTDAPYSKHVAATSPLRCCCLHWIQIRIRSWRLRYYSAAASSPAPYSPPPPAHVAVNCNNYNNFIFSHSRSLCCFCFCYYRYIVGTSHGLPGVHSSSPPPSSSFCCCCCCCSLKCSPGCRALVCLDRLVDNNNKCHIINEHYTTKHKAKLRIVVAYHSMTR